MCLPSEAAIVIGRHRFAEADLVVVPDISILHDVDAMAADVDLVYIHRFARRGRCHEYTDVRGPGPSTTHTRQSLRVPRPAYEAAGAFQDWEAPRHRARIRAQGVAADRPRA